MSRFRGEPPNSSHWLKSPKPAKIAAGGTSVRIRTLEATERLAEAALDACGITRIADVTDLDRVKIPVYNSVRPRAVPGLNTVTSGKGVSCREARVSALMEAIERTWCEPPDRVIVQSFASLKRTGRLALDPRRLNISSNSSWHPDLEIGWWPMRELWSNQVVLLPAVSIFTPWTSEAGMFASNTIGLASGNSPAEALTHGLLELIEHDHTAFGEVAGQGSEIILETVPENAARLLQRFQSESIEVRLFCHSEGVGPFTIFATTDDHIAQDGLLINGGAGCHQDPSIAAIRALCEAAQSRLTVISGAREDLLGQAYRRHSSYLEMRNAYQKWAQGRKREAFPSSRSSRGFQSPSELMAHLRDLGMPLIFATELSPPWLPFSVTKVVAPGIELAHNDITRSGPRLRAALLRGRQEDERHNLV